MDCLTAQVIAHFKKEPGNFYVYPAGSRDCGEEYVYTLSARDGVVWLKIQEGAVCYFGMPGTKQGDMPVIYDGPIAEFDAKSAKEVTL